MLDTDNMEITPEMEEHFRDYLHTHVTRVVSFAKALFDCGKIPEDLYEYIRDNHDKSKTEEPEYTPYVKRKWFERNTNKDFYEDMGDDVKAAIYHHVTTNSHHPEYWSDDYRGFATKEPCHVDNMPESCIVELVCDWEAMALEKGNTAREWFNKVRGTRWIFDERTEALIDKWISEFERKRD